MAGMGARRMAGDGSIFRRTRARPDGTTYVRWVAQASTGGRSGRVVTRRVCRTRAEAREALAGLLGGRDLSRRPLGAYLRSWLDDAVAPSVAPNTRRGYEAVLAHLAPIAGIPLRDLAPEDVEACLAGMTARRRGQAVATPASPKTRRNALAMLRHALADAERRGHVRTNAARLVAAPRVPRIAREGLAAGRVRQILAAVAGDRYEAAYALGLVGLRASEALGLLWSDVDLAAGTVRVRAQLSGSGPTAVRVPLKTAASGAVVPLPPFVVDRLRAHRERQRAERPFVPIDADGMAFLTEAGHPVNGSSMTRRLQRLLGEAGIDRRDLPDGRVSSTFRFHDLRHGFASLLAAIGVPPWVAQDLVRHARVTTTLEVYTHTTTAMHRDAMAAYGKAVGE